MHRALTTLVLLICFSTAQATLPHCQAALDPNSYSSAPHNAIVEVNDDGSIVVQHDLTSFTPQPEVMADFERFYAEMSSRNKTFAFFPLYNRAIDFSSERPDFRGDESITAYQHYVADLKKIGLYVPDLIRLRRRTGTAFLKQDNHWTNDFAKVVADNIAQHIRTWPGYAALDHHRVVLQRDLTSFIGAYGSSLAHACQAHVADEMQPRYVATVRRDLLSDSEPQVVVLGSSNMSRGSEQSFEAELEYDLRAQVVNFGVVSGDFEAAMENYLDSPAYAYTGPQYVVWESPGPIWKPDFFRREIARAKGVCQSPLFTVTTQNGSQTLSTPLQLGPQDYLALIGDGPGMFEASVTLNGAVTLALSKHPMSENNSRLFVEVGRPVSVSRLQIDSPYLGHMTLSVCRG
ncbi:alginate O-acetyltransferase AlgX-related protein [Deinococcus sonorensis]|uniref:AlgX/AlgJ SGNH hydrolase-like domain-containing protein n=2 Tax=Deinococcus sonorensis TaxID=309891 RepID=A0AAU7U9I9_9DEIO